VKFGKTIGCGVIRFFRRPLSGDIFMAPIWTSIWRGGLPNSHAAESQIEFAAIQMVDNVQGSAWLKIETDRWRCGRHRGDQW